MIKPQKSGSQHQNRAYESHRMAMDNSEAEKFYTALESEHLFIRQKKLACMAMEKKLKKARKRIEDGLKNLSICKNWRAVNHEGLLLQANLFRLQKGMKEVIVSDWEQDGAERTISLDPLAAPKDIVALYFRRSKKLEVGEGHAVRLLKKAEEDLALCLEQKRVLDEVSNVESLASYEKRFGASIQPIHKNASSIKKEPAKPYHVFISLAGIEIRVGKSAKDNDKLTFHYSNGLDWWLHASNYPGSHVVVHCQKGQEPDEETLYDAAELALRYSKAKNNGEGEVCLTQVKRLKRFKNTPGKVMVSEHRIICLVLDNKRWMRLRGLAS